MNSSDNIRSAEPIIGNCLSIMPSLMLSLKSDVMDCRVAWCRFITARSESLERPKHRHVVYEMHYLLRGSISYTFPQFGSFTAGEGSFLLIPAGTLHSTSTDDLNTEYLVIAFTVTSENEAINIVFSQGSKPFFGMSTPSLKALIDALRLKVSENDFYESLSTKLMLHSILLESVDAIIKAMGLRQLNGSSSVYSDPRVANIERIVSTNKYRQKLRGEDVAAELSITTRQLNRICNQNLGCSINQYITNVRIESMKELLCQSCYTLRDIATVFGFNDVYTFIKHFTKYAGIAPGKFRAAAGVNGNEEPRAED